MILDCSYNFVHLFLYKKLLHHVHKHLQITNVQTYTAWFTAIPHPFLPKYPRAIIHIIRVLSTIFLHLMPHFSQHVYHHTNTHACTHLHYHAYVCTVDHTHLIVCLPHTCTLTHVSSKSHTRSIFCYAAQQQSNKVLTANKREQYETALMHAKNVCAFCAWESVRALVWYLWYICVCFCVVPFSFRFRPGSAFMVYDDTLAALCGLFLYVY